MNLPSRSHDWLPMLGSGIGFVFIGFHAAAIEKNALATIVCIGTGCAWVLVALRERFRNC